MKRLTAFVLVLVLLMPLATACSGQPGQEQATPPAPTQEPTQTAPEQSGGNEPAEPAVQDKPLEGKKIAFICANQDDMYVRYGKMLEYQIGLAGGEFQVVMSDGNAQKELDNINDLIISGIDALILLAVNTATSAETVKIANEANVPIFGVAQIADLSNTDAEYTGICRYNQYDISVLVANYVLAMPNAKELKMVSIEGNLQSSGAILTRDGFSDTIEKAGLARPESVGEGKYSREGALAVAQDLIASGREWDLCFVGNEEMTAGVVQALEENGITGKILVSCNAKPIGLEMIKEGKLLATGEQPPTLIGDLLSQMIIKYFAGEQFKHTVLWAGEKAIDKSNVDVAITWDQDEYLRLKAEGLIETDLDYYAAKMAD